MRVLFTLLLLSFGLSAHATLITIDPAAPGIDLTEQENATLYRLTMGSDGSFTRSTLHSAPCNTYTCFGALDQIGLGATGNEEEHFDCVSYGSCNGPASLIEIVFDTATNYFNVEAIARVDLLAITLFDEDDNILAHCFSGITNAFSPCPSANTYGQSSSYQTISFSDEAERISRVVMGGSHGSAFPTVVTYSVPEPSSLVLMLLGLFACFSVSRRGSP